MPQNQGQERENSNGQSGRLKEQANWENARKSFKMLLPHFEEILNQIKLNGIIGQ